MPLIPPRLDDHDFDSLVRELLARVPAHTPEWSPRPGDPGRTLLELFAWLGDTLLYRANLVPERSRLAFLALLGESPRAATASSGLVHLELDEKQAGEPVDVAPLARIDGPVPFESRGEVTVYPVVAEAWIKRRLEGGERRRLEPVIAGLGQVYRLGAAAPEPYAATPIFAGGAADRAGFDLVRGTVDGQLWLALLAPSAAGVAAAREQLGDTQRLLNVGVAPALALPEALDALPERARVPHVFEMSTAVPGRYLRCEPVADSTAGLVRQGVIRLALPGDGVGAPPNDPGRDLRAGVGDTPPRLDDPDRQARLVTWLRLRPTGAPSSLALSWAGVHAVEIDQRVTVSGQVVGTGTGLADQVVVLPGRPVEAATLVLEVEEPDRGYVAWRRVEDLALARRDDAVYQLDAEAGSARFGDGVRGRLVGRGLRVRVARLRHGGGNAGNLPPGSLQKIAARRPDGSAVQRKLVLRQPLATTGGDQAETLAVAERRIPQRLRHRQRSVTAGDYRSLAAETPAVRLGRVEVLPRFKPQQRRQEVPGVVTVMVWPRLPGWRAPSPRADRPMLERVHAHLEPRRPLATELYVVSCEYVQLGVAIAVGIRDGFGQDAVLHGVREALRRQLWALPPGGPAGQGWPLGRQVRDRELEVAAARVPGVETVAGVELFVYRDGEPERRRRGRAGTVEVDLEAWQLPELLAVTAVAGDRAPLELELPAADGGGIAVPVVPELC